jgi:uncharacterized BrkB/YihY/UPF0761 family membrane protein
MPSLGLDTMHEVPTEPVKKSRWSTGLTVFVGLIIAAFTWIVISNLFVLYFGRPLIPH